MPVIELHLRPHCAQYLAAHLQNKAQTEQEGPIVANLLNHYTTLLYMLLEEVQPGQKHEYKRPCSLTVELTDRNHLQDPIGSHLCAIPPLKMEYLDRFLDEQLTYEVRLRTEQIARPTRKTVTLAALEDLGITPESMPYETMKKRQDRLGKQGPHRPAQRY